VVRAAVVIACLAALAAPGRVCAQDNYEIQVYGAQTVAPHTTMLELHSNFTWDGRRTEVDGLWPTEDAEHETLEITHGWTDWFETGFYTFTYIRDGQGWQWVGNHIRPRVRAPDSWGLPVGLSLSTEIGYQRPQVSVDTWTWEIRPIIDQTLGRWYWAVNPALERAWVGPDVTKGLEFSPAATVAYDVTRKVNLAIEYYGSWGQIHGLTSFDPYYEQQHQLFGCINLDWGPAWEFNFGIGNGWTPATDHLIAKMILGRRMPF
jgi:hypothetical protein